MAEFLITAPDGKKYKVTGATREGALAALKKKLGAAPVAPAGDTSMGTAFAVGDAQAQAAGPRGMGTLSRMLEDSFLADVQRAGRDYVANPIRERLGLDPLDTDAINKAATDQFMTAADTAQANADRIAEETNFQNLTTADIKDVPSFVNFVTQKVAQSAPQMAASVGSFGYATYPFMVGSLTDAQKDIEGLSQEQKDRAAATGALVMTALEQLGISKLLPDGMSSSIIGGIANGAVSEGVTEGLQELVTIGVEHNAGKEFTQEELLSRLKESAAAGAAAGGSIKGAGNTANKTVKIFSSDGNVNNPDNMSAEGAAAAGAFARRLREIAQANEYDLKDVNANSTKGARETVDKAHIQLAEELKKVFKDLGELVTPDKLKTFIETKDQILAQAAYREARNKTKSTVGQQELDAMRRLVGDTAEGQQAINLMLQLNQLTEVHNAGYKGGLSRITDVFNPLDQNINSYDTASRVVTGTLSPLATAAGAVSTGGASLAPQAALFGTGRAVDAMTGRRSTVDRFVRRNEGNSPDLPAPTAPSLVETKRLQEQQAQDETQRNQEQQKQLNLQLAQQDAPATPGSPQFTMEDATGLSRDGVARILRVLKGRNDNPALIRAIQEYEQSVATGGRIEDLSPLIRAVRQFQQDNPEYVPMVRPPNSLSNPMLADPAAPGQPPAVSTTEANPVQAQTFGPQFTTQENYNRGIEANKAMNAELVEGVTTDPELNRVQKGRLITSLDVLANNLGSDPVAAAQEQVQKLEEAGVPQEAIDTYVKPYVDRVTRQQAARVSPDEPMLPDVDPTSDPSVPQKPALQSYVNPLQVPDNEIDVTRLNESPSEADIQKMREGTYKPKTKRTLVEAADYMYEKWKAATGRDEPFEYTPENVDIISTYMATEAVNALQSDANAIGWYDRKLKAAKRVVSLVDPRVTQSPDAEAAFDFALAVTSNGQAVADNFQYALEVFRHFMDNGTMPTSTWKKGGERNASMVEAFDFFNAYQASGTNMPIQDFLDSDFTVNELNDYIARFNEQYGTEIKVPSSEGANAEVKGSYVIGPKIGQGFYQNIRGNYDPLTMDIWWMRMWNRLVGRPFVADPDLDKGRVNVRDAMKGSGKLEQKMINQTLKEMGVGKREINKDPALFDDFVTNVEKKYQKFYKQYKIDNGVNHVKPNFFKKTGTHVKNLKPQLQAQPKGPNERAYMRDVTKAAIAKLRDLGYNIETADFQALMWYPEKQLFRHLGVAPGRGADNDYLDAAMMLAESEGITNEQIQEALPDADGDGTVNNQPGPQGVNEGLYRGPSGNGPSTEGPIESILSDTSPGANPDGPRPDVIPAEKPQVTPEQYKKAVVELIRPQFQIGLKGGELEDGISNFNDAVEFARKLGVVVRLAMSQNELNTLLQLDTGQDPSKMGTFRGMFQRKGPKKQGKGIEGTIWAMKPGADKGDGTYVTDIEALTTLLHEISHAITLGPLDGKGDQEIYSYFINRKQSSKPGSGIVGRSDFTPPGSFTESAIKPLLDADWEQMSQTQKKAYAEIVDLQENVEAYSPKNPNERRAVRFIRQVMTNPGYSQETKQAYQDYTSMAAEFAVDPVWVYLINPKLAKKLMPTTSKMIQQEFRKANNKVIQFYAHPLAVVMAALVALEMAMDDDEERRQQQMPPGALNAPMAPGMLSQA